MAERDHINTFKLGAKAWNRWRATSPKATPDLSGVNFESDLHDYRDPYDTPRFVDYDLSSMNLNRIHARNSTFERCKFDYSSLPFSDLCYSQFHQCSFLRAQLGVSKIGSASFLGCNFNEASLSYCSAESTDFTGSSLCYSRLDHMGMVRTNLSNTQITGANVYGISAWDLNLEGAIQKDILLTDDSRVVTVDSIEIAQFIYLLISSPKIRDIIDTITSRVVLLLGRFTQERKAVLVDIKDLLRKQGYVPVLFDFEGPKSRDISETVSILAHLSRFVVADISSPRSIPQELQNVVPNLPSVPVQPIIVEGQAGYGMFEHFTSYPWVRRKIVYKNHEIPCLVANIIRSCEEYLARGRD